MPGLEDLFDPEAPAVTKLTQAQLDEASRIIDEMSKGPQYWRTTPSQVAWLRAIGSPLADQIVEVDENNNPLD